jgi:hypothetical protein
MGVWGVHFRTKNIGKSLFVKILFYGGSLLYIYLSIWCIAFLNLEKEKGILVWIIWMILPITGILLGDRKNKISNKV